MYQLTEHIFLIGFMGVGKTSTARNLSRQLGVREYDTDRLIVQQQEREISAIFASREKRHSGRWRQTFSTS